MLIGDILDSNGLVLGYNSRFIGSNLGDDLKTGMTSLISGFFITGETSSILFGISAIL